MYINSWTCIYMPVPLACSDTYHVLFCAILSRWLVGFQMWHDVPSLSSPGPPVRLQCFAGMAFARKATILNILKSNGVSHGCPGCSSDSQWQPASISKVGIAYIWQICRIWTCHYSAYSKQVCIFFDIFFCIFCILFCIFFGIFCIYMSNMQNMDLSLFCIFFVIFCVIFCILFYIFPCIFCIFQCIFYIFCIASCIFCIHLESWHALQEQGI